VSRIVALCGGVGGAKLAHGLAQLLAPGDLTLIVNTGDDFEHLGLTICPDIDTVMYTLAGKDSREHGWGREAETWRVMDELAALGAETWFKLGDKDLALHLYRLQLLRAGRTLTQATGELAGTVGVEHTVLPMANEPVRTVVLTEQGELPFQHYFVRLHCEPRVTGFRFIGADRATLSAEVAATLSDPRLSGIVVCPSNPYVSIGPILAIDGIRRKLETASVPVVAISPIVAGQALKGPAAKMMSELHTEVSSLAIARHYGDLLDALVMDEKDRALVKQRKAEDPQLFTTNTIMKTPADRIALARECLALIERLR
jgi:LPPG:FO 2-phospho-L-lactate transferase